MQTAFTFSEEGKQGPGKKKTQPRHRRATGRGRSHIQQQQWLHTKAAGSAGQLLEHEPTSQQCPAGVYKQAAKHITEHFRNLQSRGKRLQRLLLMHCNSPTSPEDTAAHPLPLRGEKSKLLLFMHPSAPLLGAWAGQGGTGQGKGSSGRCSSTSVLPIHFVNGTPGCSLMNSARKTPSLQAGRATLTIPQPDLSYWRALEAPVWSW